MGRRVRKLSSLAATALVVAGCMVGGDEAVDDEPGDGTELIFAVAGNYADAEANSHASRFNPHRNSHRGRAALDRRVCLDDIARTRARRMAAGQCPGSQQICHFDGLGAAINNNCSWTWTAAGENVGAGAGEYVLWQAFLDSADHHANIDAAAFNRFGVGAFRRASDDQLFVVHVFAHD